MIPKNKNSYALLFKILIFLPIFGFFFLQSYVVDAAEVKFAWGPPAQKDLSDAIGGYYFYWGNKSGDYVNRAHVGKKIETTATELVEGSTYYFAVTCYYNGTPEIESDFSDEIVKTIARADPIEPEPVADAGADQIEPEPVADAGRDQIEPEDIDFSGSWGSTDVTMQNNKNMLFSNFMLKNLSTKNVKSVKIRFYQSEDDSFEEFGDNKIAEHVVHDLKAGATVKMGLRIEYEAIGSEDRLIAEIDPTDNLMETNEENNISISSAIRIQENYGAVADPSEPETIADAGTDPMETNKENNSSISSAIQKAIQKNHRTNGAAADKIVPEAIADAGTGPMETNEENNSSISSAIQKAIRRALRK